MFRHSRHSIKFKIILTTICCMAFVALFCSLFLYHYLTTIIDQKADRIQQIHLTTMGNQLDRYINDVTNLAVMASNDSEVALALRSPATGSQKMRQALNAQTRLNLYLNSCPVSTYIDKLMAFNMDGLCIQGNSRLTGTNYDFQNITGSSFFTENVGQDTLFPYTLAFVPSIGGQNEPVLGLLCPVWGSTNNPQGSYVYIELRLTLFAETLAPYTEVNNILLLDGNSRLVTPLPAGLPEDFPVQELKENTRLTAGGSRYQAEHLTLENAALTLYSCTNVTSLGSDGGHILFVVVVILLASLLLACLLAVLVSNYLTRPIQCLTERIQRVAANDFSYDPSIEASNDEIGQIGRTVNEMTMSISHLLNETQDMYDRRRKIELELLQSQVNPHFLYNTLDSICWMAVIQKNTGIETMTRSLSHLLKNITKGTQDKITLREEIGLLMDYIAIQNIRYLESFSFENRLPEVMCDHRIVKFTLQPLVENAIFHGIEPTGECGIITLDGHIDGDDIVLTIEDNGIGIEPELLESLLTASQKRTESSLNGIGIANVHQRLQLIYGANYGLALESEVGCFTRVTIRLPKES